MILCIETNKVMKIINGIVNYAEPLICLVNRHPTVHIDWKFDADIPFVAGECGNPCDIYVYPMNLLAIANYYNWSIEKYYGELCGTIIHELFHINQYVDYLKSAYNADYAKMVEDSVDAYTTFFIASHIGDILDIVGCDIEIPYDERAYAKYQNSVYNIRYFGNHIKSLLLELGVSEEDANNTINCIISSQKYHIEVNGDIIPIKINGVYYNIDEINECARKIYNYKYINPETSIYKIYAECINIIIPIKYEEGINESEVCYNWGPNGYNIE